MSQHSDFWETYHRAVHEARIARAQFLRVAFVRAGTYVKLHICRQFKRRGVSVCTLCC